MRLDAKMNAKMKALKAKVTVVGVACNAQHAQGASTVTSGRHGEGGYGTAAKPKAAIDSEADGMRPGR
jgi:hypothetical protein